jgi:hypothetical protein
MQWSRNFFVVATVAAALVSSACTNNPEAAPAGAAPPAQSAPNAAPTPSESSATAHHTNSRVPEPTVDPAKADVRPVSAPAVREITVPAGTTLNLQLGSTISSKTNGVEDPVNATLRQPLVLDGVTVVPAGAAVSGYVTESSRAGRVKGRARVGVRFNALHVGDERYTIRTAAITKEAAGTKKEDAAKIGIGGGAGAITGAIVGGKKGAAIGTAVGAGGGTAVVLSTRGDEVSLPRGATVTARLAEPVKIRVP